MKAIANAFKGIVWPVLRIAVRTWLETRALVLPAARRAEAAKLVGITPAQALQYELMVREWALGEFDKFQP